MTHNRFFLLTRWFLLAGLVVLFSASMLTAQELRGRFSLPHETYWAGHLLPAGQYHFVIDMTGQKPIELHSPGGKTIYSEIEYSDTLNTTAKSELITSRSDNQVMVQVLYLADVKTAYYFRVPERYKVTSKILARSSGPVGIEHIPAYVSGN